MELKFFRCEKCEETLAGMTDKEHVQCGALVGFKPDETPIGCGGLLVEITEKQAMELAYRRRDNNNVRN